MKGVFVGVIIESGQEWVVGKFFQQKIGLIFFCQHFGQGGFAGSDVSFDNNILVFQWTLILDASRPATGRAGREQKNILLVVGFYGFDVFEYKRPNVCFFLYSGTG